MDMEDRNHVWNRRIYRKACGGAALALRGFGRLFYKQHVQHEYKRRHDRVPAGSDLINLAFFGVMLLIFARGLKKAKFNKFYYAAIGVLLGKLFSSVVIRSL